MTENAHGRPLTPSARPRPAEPLRAAPVAPYPVVLVETRVVSRQALVSYRGNRYSVPPELADVRVEVTQRLGGDLSAWAAI